MNHTTNASALLKFSALALLLGASLAPAHSPAVAAAPDTPRPACTDPNRSLAVARESIGNYPKIAAEEGVTGKAVVRVDLGADGRVQDAKLFKSSGNTWLDREAVTEARESKYLAERANCKDVKGSFLYEVNFDS